MNSIFKYFLLISLLVFSTNSYSTSQLNGLIVSPLNNLFELLSNHISNTGFVIITLTIILRITIIPLQYLSYRTTKKMELLKPKLNQIKEKFKNNSEKINKETLKLFRSNSVNPILGIVPIVFQMPLFIAMFEILRKSPLVIGAGFGGWINDLSLSDPLFILPIVAGLIQLIVIFHSSESNTHQNQNNKIKYIMALAFSGIMFTLPSGVLIYSIISSTFSIIERTVIFKIIS